MESSAATAGDPQRVENAALIHAGLFVSYPEDHAKRVSRAERESKQWSSQSLVYGEIPFETIKTIFELMRAQFGVLLDKGGRFYDLGSGCGKVILAAALLHDFSKCCGIELLDGLHAIALKVLDEWRYKTLDMLPPSKAEVDVGYAKMDLSKSDLWADATLVFCNMTCFEDQLLDAITNVADQLVTGSYFVSVGRPLSSTKWKSMHEQKFAMSWGQTLVYIQKKVV